MPRALAADVFNCVFNTSLDLSLPIRVSQLEQALAHTRAANGGQLPYVACVQLDRSQNHLMAQEDGLNAKRRKKRRGFKEKNPHIRPPTWPMRLNTRFGREYNCLADGSCEQCKKDVRAWMAEHGDIFDLRICKWWDARALSGLQKSVV